MKIKAVIMDGDGSTLTSDNQLPDNLRQLITSRPDIKWIMATGRSLDLLKKTPIYNYLSSDTYHIVDGGSCLMDLTGKTKIRHFLNSQELENLALKLRLQQANFVYYSPDGLCGYAYSNQPDMQQKFKFHDELVSYTDNLNQFLTWLGKYPPGKILLNAHGSFDLDGLYYHQNDNNYDITTLGINKSTAYIELLEMLKLTPQQTAFVFNDKNDLPIILNPKLKDVVKLKVGNQLPEIAGDYNADTPYQVAPILNSLLN